MQYRFLLNSKDITDNIINFSYTENLNDVATSFSFSAYDKFGITSNINGKDVLNRISIYDTTIQANKNALTEPFYVGFITDSEHTTDKNIYNYIGFDVGFYLNKNEVIKQFRKANIGDAIIDLCKEYKINLVKMPEFKATVSKIYKDVAFSEIIKELLLLEKNKGGTRNLYIDCKNGNLNIKKYTYEKNLSAYITNIIKVDSHNTLKEINVKHSIQDLKNKVVYTDNNQKSLKSISKENFDSIAIYGLLQTVETIDTNKNNNLKQLAERKLDELNQPKEEMSLTILGDYKIGKCK